MLYLFILFICLFIYSFICSSYIALSSYHVISYPIGSFTLPPYPIPSHPILLYHIPSHAFQFDHIRFNSIPSCPTISHLTLSPTYPILLYPLLSYLILSYLILFNLILSYPISSRVILLDRSVCCTVQKRMS